MPPPSFYARLVSSRTLTPSVRELTFEKPDGPMRFAPGQWVNLTLPEAEPGTQLVRAYSIASAPDESSRFSLAVTRVEQGRASKLLHELSLGEQVRVSGPQGFFTRDANAGIPSLFVGTGTGLTPFLSMLRAAAAVRATEPLWLLAGVRTEADCLYSQELTKAAAQLPGLRVHYTLSKPSSDWPGHTGYVQSHLASLWSGLLKELQGTALPPPQVYVCGLERMVKAVREHFRKGLGLPRERVQTERYD